MDPNPNPYDGYKKAHATLVQLAEAGLFEVGLDAIIRKPGNAARAIAALMREFELDQKNEFEITLDEQLARFADRLSEMREVGLTFDGCTDEQVLEMLRKTAPAWPRGKRCFRFIQIREGVGDEGVQKTFEAHASMMEQAFTPKFWRWEEIKTDKERLRLLKGNQTHTPTIGWVCADMNANRERESITAVRGDKSLADEILAFAWQFPEYCKAIDYKKNPGLFAAGYELEVDGYERWGHVPIVYRYLGDGKVRLRAGSRADDRSDCAVPSRLRE